MPENLEAPWTPPGATMHLGLVGGAFSLDGPGRASGYFRKFGEALRAALPGARMTVLNGGSYAELAQLERFDELTHLFWFADVPNELPKLLPAIKRRLPRLLLIQSKNNRSGKYTRAELFARMHASRSELLVEFTGNPGEPAICGAVLGAQCSVLAETGPSIEALTEAVALRLTQLATLEPPLRKAAYVTSDAASFGGRDFRRETEVPIGAHPGAFGTCRRWHRHEGVDLYAHEGDPVYAMESGLVVYRGPFTGPAVGSPWWLPTECVLLQGASGALNYGEIEAVAALHVGKRIRAGEVLGTVKTVLTRDKGRPMAMLHLERYRDGTQAPVQEWARAAPRPATLCDPTDLLLQAYHDFS